MSRDRRYHPPVGELPNRRHFEPGTLSRPRGFGVRRHRLRRFQRLGPPVAAEGFLHLEDQRSEIAYFAFSGRVKDTTLSILLAAPRICPRHKGLKLYAFFSDVKGTALSTDRQTELGVSLEAQEAKSAPWPRSTARNCSR